MNKLKNELERLDNLKLEPGETVPVHGLCIEGFYLADNVTFKELKIHRGELKLLFFHPNVGYFPLKIGVVEGFLAAR